MRKLSTTLFAVGLALVPTAAGVTTAALTVAAPAAHADQYDCSSSWLPCDGTNLDFNDSLGDTPMPYDEDWSVWDQSYDTGYLGDPGTSPGWDWLGDPAYDEPLGDTCGYADAGC